MLVRNVESCKLINKLQEEDEDMNVTSNVVYKEIS